jgi:hypothetical protein
MKSTAQPSVLAPRRLDNGALRGFAVHQTDFQQIEKQACPLTSPQWQAQQPVGNEQHDNRADVERDEERAQPRLFQFFDECGFHAR